MALCERSKEMGMIINFKIGFTVVCLVFFLSIVHSYGAQGNAEKFFEEGKKIASVENADQTIDIYSKAIKINPKFAKAYNNRGIAYMWKKQYDNAVADFNKAIEFDPKNGKAYNNRAIVYSYQGETDKALKDLKKAKSLGIEVNPKFLKEIEEIPATPESIFHKPAPYPAKAPAPKR
jgi:tetratricopeptide (TPR) repeat protein